MKWLHRSLVLAGVSGLAFQAPAFAQCERKLTSPGGPGWESFGTSVALDGDLALVGEWGETGAGAVWVFDVKSGQPRAKLLASDFPDGYYFGFAVAADQGRALIGSVGFQTGAAYVFDLSTGTELFKLVSSDAVPYDGFGTVVAIDGSLAVVGAPSHEPSGDKRGAAYVFDVTTGAQLWILRAPDGAKSDYFGQSVAIDGNLALVGAPFDDDGGKNSGSVYVFDATTGVFLRKILAPDQGPGGSFGRAVAIEGDIGLVSAPAKDAVGAVYVFDLTTGERRAKLAIGDIGEEVENLGGTLAVDGGRVLVGSWWPGPDEEFIRSVHLFEIATGRRLARLSASDGTLSYGNAVALEGERCIVGARYDGEDGGLAPGAAILHDLADGDGDGIPDCSEIGASFCGPAVANSTGRPGAITASGSSVVTAADVILHASALPPDRWGVFLTSRTQGLSQPPGSQGNLCLGGGIGTFRDHAASTGPAGLLSLRVDLAAIPTPAGPWAVLSGETWSFQCWFRDVNPMTTSNFTDGVGILFR